MAARTHSAPSRRVERLVPSLLLAAPILLVILLRTRPDLDLYHQNAHFHLWIVSAIAGSAAVVAVMAGIAAVRSRQSGPLWLAIGCLSTSVLMFGHGITTPGVHHMPMNTWVGRLPFIAIALFALCLTLAGGRRNGRTARLAARQPALMMIAVAGPLLVAVAVLYADPMAMTGSQSLPHEALLKDVFLVASTALFTQVARRHWGRFLLGRDGVQFALFAAGCLCIGSVFSLRFGSVFHVSWWIYHVLLLMGFLGAIYAVAASVRRRDAVEHVLSVAFDVKLLTHIVEGYPEALHSLVAAVELKDAYTAGHSQRTATLAVELGERMGLSQPVLRALAHGGYLHDVGKITIPDAILNKPARLDPEERLIIETHPSAGYELVLPVPELHHCLDAVRHHHERFDGGGYPHGLEGGGIPFIARVVSVVDVWDALTSDRAYRPGMTPSEALAHMIAGRGTHFDPDVIDAFVAMAASWGYRSGGEGDVNEAWRAAQTCHEIDQHRVGV